MTDAGDRMDRAGRYVLGLMDDDERERAERDLEIDPAFRDAMMVIAERMHVFDRMPAPDKAPQDQWRLIKDRIDAMPQMRPADDPRSVPPGKTGTVRAQLGPPDPGRQEGEAPEKPVTFGRRKSDVLRAPPTLTAQQTATRVALHSVPGRRALVLAISLVAMFALGYLAGVSSPWWLPPQ